LKHYPKLLYTIVFFILFFSCHRKEEKHVHQRAFYYWKSIFSFKSSDSIYFSALKINTLYLRFFDVGLHAKGYTIPQGSITFQDKVPSYLNIIPVVFITNEAILATPDSLIEKLAYSIILKTKLIISSNKISKPKEIQIDCDWTFSSREKYFRLLIFIKEKQSAKISATLRLHQVKFKNKTGIPPAEKVMLMCYNMGSPKKYGPSNAILDNELVNSYTVHLNDYPIRMDIALPLFSWAVQFRNKKFVTLINNIKIESLEKHEDFDKLEDNLYRAKRNTHIRDYVLFENDVLRVDETNEQSIREAAQTITKNLKTDSLTVSLFHYDNKILDTYDKETIRSIYNSFN
jgi:hypothetical protein